MPPGALTVIAVSRTLAAGALILVAGCGGTGDAHRPRVAAAASLAGVAADLLGPDVEIAYGATSTLARQIAAGWQVDVLLAAHVSWVDDLERRGLVAARRELCRNRLVLAGRAGSAPVGWDELASSRGRIAIGDPAHVPAGIYARRALEAAGFWEAVEGRLVPAQDVRAALAYTARGACELAIVYATDMRVVEGVTVLAAVPAELTPPIRYEAALLVGHGGRAARLFEQLFGPEAREILAGHGFVTDR